jgi:glycosyltransferase involved in cell wall biosynthesis
MSVLNLNYSIFLPIYNADRYIENFCKNILIQTTKPDQIVFVDDGENSDNIFIKIRNKNTGRCKFKINLKIRIA